MKPDRIASWALGLGFAGALIGLVALPKFFGPDPNPIFAIIAGRSGIMLFEPAVRHLVGLAELVSALLLILPATRGAGALLAGGVTLGAIGFHLSPWLGVAVPDTNRVVVELKAGRTIAEIDTLGLATDAGALFVTALVFLALAAAIAVLERQSLAAHTRRLGFSR